MGAFDAPHELYILHLLLYLILLLVVIILENLRYSRVALIPLPFLPRVCLNNGKKNNIYIRK